jgi:hypothetical protein
MWESYRVSSIAEVVYLNRSTHSSHLKGTDFPILINTSKQG